MFVLHHVIESGYYSSFHDVHNPVIVFKTSKLNEDGDYVLVYCKMLQLSVF